MNKNNSYKGWTNKETWFYSLDLFNDDTSYMYWNHKAFLAKDDWISRASLAKEMKEYALSEASDSPCPFVEDLAKYSIEQIDFEELAEELLKRLDTHTVLELN